ncbi:MAG: hypothetical protein MZV63_25445 [Marinilabiliales bacterium]|nr:hypothetical protein [Marinilabiliales bacterium]
MSRLRENFDCEGEGIEKIYKPARLHNFSMYLEGKWYSLTARQGTYNDNDPIGDA